MERQQQQRHQGEKPELEVPPRCESHGSDPLSRRHRARIAGWVDERGGYVCPQSRIVEAYGGGISEMAGNSQSVVRPPQEMEGPSGLHEMEDAFGIHEEEKPSVLLTKPLPPAPRHLRGSPDLHDPIKSEPNRESLHQKLRGKLAPHHHRSSANPCRNDWTPLDVSEDAISSSGRHSIYYECLQSVPNGGDKTPNNNACTIEDGASAPYQPCAHPTPHEVSPEDPAPTTNYAHRNAAFPSSPNAALASLPSEMPSPLSPINEDVHPPLTIASSVTLSHLGSSPQTLEHQEENARCRTSIPSSHLQMLKEPNNMPFPSDYIDSDSQSLFPFYHSIESSAPIASHTENTMSQLSFPVVQNQFQSADAELLSVFTQPHHVRMCPSDIEGFIPSKGSEKVSEVENSLSVAQSAVTQVCTPRSENQGFSPTTISSISSPHYRHTEPDSRCAINIQSPPEPTQPFTAFRISPLFRSLNRQLGIVTGPVGEMGGFGNSNTSTQNLEQSVARQSLCPPELQSWSPLNHFKATSALDLHSTGSQWCSNDHCQQAAPQHHSHDSVTWRPYCFYHNSQVSRLAPKQKHVEDHRKFIHEINYQWMQRIQESQPGLWSHCSTLSALDLFDRAMWTGKNFICDSPVKSFEDVFAIVHMAFAAAFSWTWQQDDYEFSALHNDALHWQHVLPSEEDKTRFLNAMDCWEFEPSPLLANACHTDFGSTLTDRLKKGEVFKAFIAFVDSKLIRC